MISFVEEKIYWNCINPKVWYWIKMISYLVNEIEFKKVSDRF